jgi:hypothetical protein
MSEPTIAAREGERSGRYLVTIPIVVWGDGEKVVRAHTVVVNPRGALILTPRSFHAGALLRIVNQDNGKKAMCRVAWCGGEELPGLFKIGIELLGLASDFWSTPAETPLESRAT